MKSIFSKISFILSLISTGVFLDAYTSEIIGKYLSFQVTLAVIAIFGSLGFALGLYGLAKENAIKYAFVGIIFGILPVFFMLVFLYSFFVSGF